MLETIANRSDCPYQGLCSRFPVTKATVSHHMKELINAGLVESEREGQTMTARFRPDVLEAYRAELAKRLEVRRSDKASRQVGQVGQQQVVVGSECRCK